MISGTPFKIVDAEKEWGWIGPLAAGVDPGDNDGYGIWQSCKEGSALCLVSDEALLVVELQPSGNGDLELFVRLTVARGEKGTIQRNDAHLDSIAREMGAKKIVFWTYRRGMHKLLGPDWNVQFTSFERAVKHG